MGADRGDEVRVQEPADAGGQRQKRRDEREDRLHPATDGAVVGPSVLVPGSAVLLSEHARPNRTTLASFSFVERRI